MGNATSTPVVLTSDHSSFRQEIILSPENPLHRLDPSYDAVFVVNTLTLPSFIRSVEPNQGTVSHLDSGEKGSLSFVINRADHCENIDDAKIEVSVNLLALRISEMVGTPCVIRNTITIPVSYKNASADTSFPSDLPPLEVKVRFN